MRNGLSGDFRSQIRLELKPEMLTYENYNFETRQKTVLTNMFGIGFREFDEKNRNSIITTKS